MKIKVTQTIEIDPKKWAIEYGINPADVREDVKCYFSDAQERVEALGLQLDFSEKIEKI